MAKWRKPREIFYGHSIRRFADVFNLAVDATPACADYAERRLVRRDEEIDAFQDMRPEGDLPEFATSLRLKRQC